jgi:hypothetical protein
VLLHLYNTFISWLFTKKQDGGHNMTDFWFGYFRDNGNIEIYSCMW